VSRILVVANRTLHGEALRAVLPQATALSFPFTVREVVKLGLTGGRSGALPGEDERLRVFRRAVSAV
jgi:iron complex transport system ATP-binding protein